MARRMFPGRQTKLPQKRPTERRARSGGADFGARRRASRLSALAFFELRGDFQLALRVLGPPEVAIGLAEQVMRDGIVGIHCQRALQTARGQLRLTFLL